MRRILILSLLVMLSACGESVAQKPKSVEELGIATPADPVNNPARLEVEPGAPIQMPVPNTAVPRATDAGANDEGGPIEPRE